MTFSMTRVFADAGAGPAARDFLSENLRARSYDAGEFIIHQGEPAPDIYYLRQGLAKMSYLTADGKEFVKSFLPEGEFMGSLAAQMGGREATFSIVCLEPVAVEILSYEDVSKLADMDAAVQKLVCRLFQALALKKELREYEFLCLPPEDRYRAFLAAHSGLAKRVTQADIARYLGITPVALSRIRGRLKAT